MPLVVGSTPTSPPLRGDDWCSKGQRLAAVVVGASPTLRQSDFYIITKWKMEIEIPFKNIRTNKGSIPYTQFLYLLNLLTLYKAEVLTRNRLRSLIEDYLWDVNVSMDMVMDNIDFDISKNRFQDIIVDLLIIRYKD